MLFNSLAFLLFFPIVVLLYWILPHRYRNLMLLVASYYFYMNWEPIYALLILGSTVVTYLCSLGIDKTQGKYRKTYIYRFRIEFRSVVFIQISKFCNCKCIWIFRLVWVKNGGASF